MIIRAQKIQKGICKIQRSRFVSQLKLNKMINSKYKLYKKRKIIFLNFMN